MKGDGKKSGDTVKTDKKQTEWNSLSEADKTYSLLRSTPTYTHEEYKGTRGGDEFPIYNSKEIIF